METIPAGAEGNLMATQTPGADSSAPHCGVCQHAEWHWSDQSMYCTSVEDSTEIRISTVCDRFEPVELAHGDIDFSQGAYGDPPSKLDAANQTRPTDEAECVRGSEGPFFAAYFADGERRYGWFCWSCRSLDVLMDTMGRVVCHDCENETMPAEWDSAYL